MRRIRLAFLLANLRPGGAERQMLLLAKHLPCDHFQVDFLSLVGQGPLDSEAEAAGAKVRTIGSRPLFNAPITQRALGRSQKILSYIETVRRGRYDIVDAWLYPEDVVGVLTRHLTRTPVVMSGRRNLDLHNSLGPLSPAVDRAMARLTDAVVANSQAAADFASRHHHIDPTKLRVIRNGVTLPQPITLDERRAMRLEFGVHDEQMLIGCVGNYREVKRHALLLEAFADTARNRPALRLVLIGEGPLRSDIERQVIALGLTDRVRVHGSVLNMKASYGAFDVVVQASRSEGLPNVLLEAAAAGLPIVATAAGGSAEVVRDGDTGLLVPIEDAAQLSRAIGRVADDTELRERLGAAARLHVATDFGVDRFVAEFSDLYTDLVETKRARRSSERASQPT